MTKSSSIKQVIIPISNENKVKFIKSSSTYITNFNKVLKNIKSEVMADFICMDQVVITIIKNKVILSLDLQTIEKYVKNTNYINSDKVKTPWLSQLESYLKIIDILYLLENTNTPILTDIVEMIIKNNYIFNNIIVASKP